MDSAANRESIIILLLAKVTFFTPALISLPIVIPWPVPTTMFLEART